MRIEILYLDHKSKNTIALSNFLNYNLIEIDHGTTFNAVFITLINNPKKTQKFKRRFLYKKYADIAIPVYSDYDDELSVENFQKEFEFLESCLHLVHEIEVTPFDFDEDLLRKDLEELKKRIPKTEEELNYWLDEKEELRDQIVVKYVNGKINQRRKKPKELVKLLGGFRIYDKKDNVLLRPYFNLYCDILSHFKKKIKIFTPGYNEIYFSFSDQLDDAKTEFPLEDWHQYTYAVLDYNLFSTSSEEGRFNLLYTSIAEALQGIAEIDGLDIIVINSLLTALQNEIALILKTNDSKGIADVLESRKYNERIQMNRKK
ncbi:hypothetical protein [Flavobacterium sp. '19STA2R22 D10 B1']|uniref:hypothetical protein n=1 Tax=Flavobacterium aerium TaxID=3037261 RepID=UPI00278BBCF5|nr:hypothetical protein [Flavobacterium sp. '19STA2R22 D10 B1']